MARTNSTNLALVIELDSDVAPDAFIEIANELVTEMCTGTNAPSTAYSDERLEHIERWLAAHFYALRVRDSNPFMQKADVVSQSFKHKLAENLGNTVWGQTAMMLDSNGKLAQLSKSLAEGGRQTVGVSWLGKPVNEQQWYTGSVG